MNGSNLLVDRNDCASDAIGDSYLVYEGTDLAFLFLVRGLMKRSLNVSQERTPFFCFLFFFFLELCQINRHKIHAKYNMICQIGVDNVVIFIQPTCCKRI